MTEEDSIYDVGGEGNPSVITPAHWEALAKQCDVRPQFLGNLVRETADALQEWIKGVSQFDLSIPQIINGIKLA